MTPTAVLRLSIALGVALALTVVMLGGWVKFVDLVTDEVWCLDRVPYWGPPTDPNSECSGFAWTEKHPGEFPWTLPR